MIRRLFALVALLVFGLAGSASVRAEPEPYAICSKQIYALCAAASAFVYDGVSYAKCVIKWGDSISAPPLSFTTRNGQTADICDVNALGVRNGYMMSTFSLPQQVKVGGNKALYTCPSGSTGSYAQCDGGTCFDSTRGQFFPGVGRLTNDEIMCSCPITKTSTSTAPFGFQFVGPFPCDNKAFKYCNQNAKNGDIIPVGSPPGAGRLLTQELYGRTYALNQCRM